MSDKKGWLAPIKKHPFLTLFLLSSFLRLVVTFHFRNEFFAFFTDQDGYLEIANNILQGKGMGGVLNRTPLYPAYLAFYLWLFPGKQWAAMWAIKFSQALIASFLPLVLVLLGHRLFNKAVGWWAGIISAIYPFFLIYPSFLLTESNFIFFLLCWILVFYDCWETGKRAWLLGLLSGLNSLYRPSNLYFFPFLCIFLFCFQRKELFKRWKPFFVAFLVYFLVLTPWIYRNYKITQHFVPGTVHLGWFLYVGNSDLADGSAIDSEIVEEERVKALSLYERDRHYFRLATSWILKNPASFLKLGWVKFIRTWNVFPNFHSLKTFWLKAISFLSVAPVILLGFIGICRTRKTLVWYLILSPILYYTLIHIITVGSIRYRVPAMPYVILFAATQLAFLGDYCSRHFRAD